MQNIGKALLAGAAGAITVTLLHEFIRKQYTGAPRLDLLGEQALQKSSEALHGPEVPADSIYGATMAADILSNALYYSAAAVNKDSPILAGASLGLAAGVGAVELPDKIGLDGSLTASTPQRMWITIGLYTLGGLVTGFLLKK